MNKEGSGEVKGVHGQSVGINNVPNSDTSSLPPHDQQQEAKKESSTGSAPASALSSDQPTENTNTSKPKPDLVAVLERLSTRPESTLASTLSLDQFTENANTSKPKVDLVDALQRLNTAEPTPASTISSDQSTENTTTTKSKPDIISTLKRVSTASRPSRREKRRLEKAKKKASSGATTAKKTKRITVLAFEDEVSGARAEYGNDVLVEAGQVPSRLAPRKGTAGISHTGEVSAYPFLYHVVEKPALVNVPTLAHGLERVLFNPGVHMLKDPRTNVYNFDPWLKNIDQPADFDYSALPEYIPAAQDSALLKLAQQHNRTYYSSTSSMTNLLSTLYLLITGNKEINASNFTMSFQDQDGHYGVEIEKPGSTNTNSKNKSKKSKDIDYNIMMQLGKSMEKMLTLAPKDFSKYLKSSADVPREPMTEAYNFATIENFMVRSQIDCQDPRLPRQTFDLKTRAALPIRMDPQRYLELLGYKVNRNHGLYNSFEREYYDMLRSALLKHSFQVRLGNMDGIFICYHNTSQVFGFQYVSLEEMDVNLFGDSGFAKEAFAVTMKLLQKVLDVVTEKFYGKSFRMTLAIRTLQIMDLYIEPIHESSNGKDSRSTSNSTSPVEVYKYRVTTESVLEIPQARPSRRGTKTQDRSTSAINYAITQVVYGDEEQLQNEYRRVRAQCPNLAPPTAGEESGKENFLRMLKRLGEWEDGDGRVVMVEEEEVEERQQLRY
ncbi:hypothetical protein HK102_013603 [Quaeritorhiza haematococci]|nr:hypothetical protein HK102_013603 [Quaeritorhiza haematococci]